MATPKNKKSYKYSGKKRAVLEALERQGGGRARGTAVRLLRPQPGKDY